MVKTHVRLLLIMLLATTGIAYAQNEGKVFTFDSGVRFTVPAGAVLDDSDAIPAITLDKSIVVQVLEPATLNQIVEIRRKVELPDVLDVLLGKVGFQGKRTEDATFTIKLADGRDAIVFDFVNSAKNHQSVMVLLLSNEQMAALNIRSLNSLTGAQRDALLALAASLDVSETGASTQPSAEQALTQGLAQEFTYDSGVGFRYPDSYAMINENEPVVDIGIANVILITMVDPNIVNMPAGEAIDDIITFAIKGTPVKASDFEPLDIGGREAVIGSAKSGQIMKTLVLVRFADDTVGIMDIASPGTLKAAQLDEVRRIAASFNTVSTDAHTPTRADIVQSEALFEQADAARKAKDYAKAIDLFTQAIKLDTNFALAYYWRGATYHSAGDLENALPDYQQALALKPAELQVHEDIAEVYALLDELDRAIAEYEAWIDASGGKGLSADSQTLYELIKNVAAGKYDRNFYFKRADQLRLYGRFDAALRDNQLSLDHLPNDAKLYAQRGVIYMDMKQYSKAVQMFTNGIAVEPLPILFYNRGFANQANFRNDPGAVVDAVHDFQCTLLLADDSLSAQQLKDAQHGIDITFISDDSYQPITDPAQCVK